MRKKLVEDAYRYGEIAPEKRQMIRKILYRIRYVRICAYSMIWEN